MSQDTNRPNNLRRLAKMPWYRFSDKALREIIHIANAEMRRALKESRK